MRLLTGLRCGSQMSWGLNAGSRCCERWMGRGDTGPTPDGDYGGGGSGRPGWRGRGTHSSINRNPNQGTICKLMGAFCKKIGSRLVVVIQMRGLNEKFGGTLQNIRLQNIIFCTYLDQRNWKINDSEKFANSAHNYFTETMHLKHIELGKSEQLNCI